MKSCTPADLLNEAAFASRFAARFPSAALLKLNDQQKVDFAVTRAGDPQRVVGFVEFKARACPSDRYPVALLNVQKWLAVGALHRATGLPVWLAFGYSDGDLLYRYRDGDLFDVGYVETFGEACVLIPTDRFRPLGAGSQAS